MPVGGLLGMNSSRSCSPPLLTSQLVLPAGREAVLEEQRRAAAEAAAEAELARQRQRDNFETVLRKAARSGATAGAWGGLQAGYKVSAAAGSACLAMLPASPPVLCTAPAPPRDPCTRLSRSYYLFHNSNRIARACSAPCSQPPCHP
jgi:hypothetical protein